MFQFLLSSFLFCLVAMSCLGQQLKEEDLDMNDMAGDKFKKCCDDSGMNCPEVCTYPPPDFTIKEQWFCMPTWVSVFIKCYTVGHDNRKCCADHGVVGPVYGICQDFCDGTHDHSWGIRYMLCGPMKNVISKCNHDSVNKTF